MREERKHHLLLAVKTSLGELAGQDLSGVDAGASFFELGFDSLLLTQAAAALKNKFRVKITFRQLLESLTSLDALVAYLDEHLPAESAPNEKHSAVPIPAAAVPRKETVVAACATAPKSTNGFSVPVPERESLSATENSVLERVMKEQLALMARQLEMLRGGSTPEPAFSTPVQTVTPSTPPTSKVEPKAFGPYRPINTRDARDASAFTDRQREALTALMERYIRKTPESKRQTQNYRANFADPRSVAGFRPFWKEMVYPIITTRSEGARFWDVDGNEYIDVTMGFGTNLLGHTPSFIVNALNEQLKKGIEVGPQSPLAGQVAQMLCKLTGHERAAFCNTGSEAVLAAIRVARTVSGRTRIATCGGFHGINDEVLVRGNVVGGRRVSMPIAPGIPEHVAREVLVVDYGAPESLEILRQQMDDLALVLVEPVQSRHPDLQPREFLHELRRLTAEHDTALMFDEVITGFRCNLGGAQAHFGVRADLACWGKIIGGGMPIGALTGAARYMDALDGGFWQYGDASFPEVGVTFFAGTYVRHPMTLAASHAMLTYLTQQGPRLQEQLNDRTQNFIGELRQFLRERAIPLHAESFASMFYFHFAPEVTHGSLFWFYLRDKGIHFWEGRPAFLSTAHTDDDIARLLRAIKESLIEMQEAGFLPPAPAHKDRMDPPRLDQGRGKVPETPPVNDRIEIVSPNKPQHGNVQPASILSNGAAHKGMDFSIYFFGNYEAEYRPDKYKTILEAARFADGHGFKAIWIPERHFHPVGGFSPNPSILAAALSRETHRLQLRAGSVVLPLHHPVRVAEEWAVVDNLSGGRVGISIASGWHPNDFVFAPEAFDRRRELCWEGSEIIQKLWRGEEVSFPTGGKNVLNVKLHPLPKQSKLPIWLTCIHKESYIKAGELGMGVLGYMMNTTREDLAEKIRLYREAFSKAGHNPAQANVTILLHTFIGADRDAARSAARQPMRDYLRSYLDNSRKRLESQNGDAPIDQEDIEYLLDRAFDDYVQGKSLIGSPESCASVVAEFEKMGVDEIGCFLDFGVTPDLVLAHLPHLVELQRLCHSSVPDDLPISNGKDVVPKNCAATRTIGLPEAQKGLVAIAALGKDACRTYTEANTLELRGQLDLPALRRALQRCVDRHEALRTSLDADGQSQTIHANCLLDVPLMDFSNLTGEEQSNRVPELFRAMEGEPIDLRQAPCMITKVVKLADNRHLLLVFFHHTTGNGPSYWIFFEDLCAFYEAECGVTPFERPEPMQFSAYVDWRLQRTATPEHAAAESFWLKQLAGGPPVLELPTDWPRAELKSYRGGRAVLRLDAALNRALRQAGAAHKCSLYMVLLTAYKALMHRISGQDDLVVGTPFESEVRSLPGGEGLFANTTNMTVLRSQTNSDTTFADMLAFTRSQILECNEHQDFFFGNLAQKLGLRSRSGRSALFSVAFNYESGKFLRRAGGVEFEYLTDRVPYRCPKDTAMFDLNLNVAEQDGELLCECDYDADLFDEATVSRMLDQLKVMLTGAALNPTQRLCELPLMTELERKKILVEWNQTAVAYPKNRTLHKLIEDQAALTPDAMAVTYEGASLTYSQLNARANQLARYLQGLGVRPDTLVGICVERSLEMVIGLLGILKAGGAYVPLDPEYPKERLAFMLADAGTSVLLTQAGLEGALPPHSGRTIRLDADWSRIAGENSANPEPTANAENLAYMIYTSGSTGRPKGAMNTHVAIVNRLLWMQDAYHLGPSDRVLQKTPFSFDVSVWEFFWPLLTGATLVVAAPGGHRDGAYLTNLIQREKVTTTHFVPSMLTAFLEQSGLAVSCASLKRVICSGEALPFELQQRFFSLLPAELHNLYGPTEAAVDVTYWACERNGQLDIVPIGRPIANTQIYILDRHLQPTPMGVPGELHIGGVGLARGYHNRPELTAEKFISDPFRSEPGARLYKTGDLARYLSNGAIEYLGRLDHQVKIRGFRIELGEIEAALDSHPAVRESVVVVREDKPGQKTLVAYVAPRTNATANGHSADAEMAGQWQTQWERIYQTALAEIGDQSEALQNIDSVINRDTNLENIAAHTKEWIDVTVQRIQQFKPRRILEAGCGTGQLLLRFAPGVEAYWGSDFADAAVDKLQEEAQKRGLESVRLLHCAADCFEGIPNEFFDLFILNSVSQYFPDVDYLMRVLEGAVKTIAPGGRMYIGDVQSRTLLECFHAGSQLKSAPPELTVEQINHRVRQRVGLEAELVVDPEFFKVFQTRIPQITAVDVQLRRGHLVNETTQYHYDVILTVGGSPRVLAVPEWVDWRAEKLTETKLRERLKNDKPQSIGIRGVPNARLLPDVAVLNALSSAPVGQTALQLRASLSPAGGIDPETLWIMGDELNYHVDVRWHESGVSGEIDVVFSRMENRDAMCVTEFGPAASSLKQWSEYANNPARSMLASKLPQILVEHVKSRLPEHMAPSTVVALDDLPRTPNGKVDRKALPAPTAVARLNVREFVAAGNEKEKTLAAIWMQLLGLEKVSVQDNFFELGGDSLVGFRAVNRAVQAGLPMTLRMLFQHKTIAGIVNAIESNGTSNPATSTGPAVIRVSRQAHKRVLASIG